MPTPTDVTLFLAGLIVGYVIYSQRADSREATRAAMEHMSAVNDRLLISLTGLNPHVVNPKVFGPTGMARVDEEREATRASQPGPATAQSPFGEAEDALREAERVFFAQQQLARERAAASGGISSTD